MKILVRCFEEMVNGDRATVMSKIFQDIAIAMDEQWGKYLERL